MGTTTTLVSLEEYLRTSYHPDCDFVDGEIEERNVGELEHSELQGALITWFFNHGREWEVKTLPEQRIRVAPRRVRIADICLLRRDAPREKVAETPPLLCIEILSPEDRIPRVIKVMDDYVQMGVKHLWWIDPLDRVGYVYTGGGVFKLTEGRLEVAGTPIYVDLPELFAQID